MDARRSTIAICFRYRQAMSHYLALQEWSTNLLGACADRANITMEGAVCAKHRHGTTAPDLGHQQFAPMGENHFRALGT